MDEIRNNNMGNSGYFTPFDVDRDLESNFSSVSFFQRVSSLPESVKDIMVNPSTAEFVEEKLSPEFGLNIEQKINITRIIRDVLLGDISINSMAAKISERLNIDPKTAYEVQGEIINKLFGSVISEIEKRQKPLEKLGPRHQNSVSPPVLSGNIVDLRNPNNNQ